MQQHSAHRASARTATIDRRPAVALTALSILASLLVAYQVCF